MEEVEHNLKGKGLAYKMDNHSLGKLMEIKQSDPRLERVWASLKNKYQLQMQKRCDV